MAPKTEAKRDYIICCPQITLLVSELRILSMCFQLSVPSPDCTLSAWRGEGGWRETEWDPLKQIVGLIALKFHEHSSSSWHSGLGATISFYILPFEVHSRGPIARRRYALYTGPLCAAFVFSPPSSSHLPVVPHFANLPSFQVVKVERSLN